jgi:nucleoid-associated protein YgaU
MTSDAKIGLLLGLVFIFIIAFIINGIPTFDRERNNNELTTNMVESQNTSPGIATSQRRVTRQVITPQIRSITPLPKTASQPEEPTKTIEIKRPLEPAPTTVTVAAAKPKPQSTKPAGPKIYVVKDGDSLATIAQKVYGQKEGNRQVNVDKIFNANRKILAYPDEIFVSQRLVIPPLKDSGQAQKNSVTDDENLFQKVASIGKRHLTSSNAPAKKNSYYVVADGDSLWEIAADKLGDGSRYTEITRLNTDVINDEDNLIVGTRLKLPAP